MRSRRSRAACVLFLLSGVGPHAELTASQLIVMMLVAVALTLIRRMRVDEAAARRL